MENKKVQLLRALAKNFSDLADIFETEGSAPATTAAAKAPATSKPATPASAPAKAFAPVKEEKTAEGKLDKAQLDAMKYNDLKSFAKQCGVDCTGNRDAITERLLGVSVEAPVDESEPEDDGEEVDVQAQVETATADMSVEEIGELLTSVGVAPKGKRQALIALVVKAVNDGLIDLNGDEEGGEESSAEAEEQVDEESGEEAEDYFPEDMTEAREEACKALDKELRAEYKSKGLSDKEIAETCEAFYLDHEGYDASLPKADKLQMYIEATQRMVDDDGEQHEFKEPYNMNDQGACCGHYLKTVESGNLFCEVCGQEFETEE